MFQKDNLRVHNPINIEFKVKQIATEAVLRYIGNTTSRQKYPTKNWDFLVCNVQVIAPKQDFVSVFRYQMLVNGPFYIYLFL